MFFAGLGRLEGPVELVPACEREKKSILLEPFSILPISSHLSLLPSSASSSFVKSFHSFHKGPGLQQVKSGNSC